MNCTIGERAVKILKKTKTKMIWVFLWCEGNNIMPPERHTTVTV
jgi:hypothetical protein